MVEVFRTNIETEQQAVRLLKQFKKTYPAYHINLDLEDCDNILRVDSHNNQIDVNRIIETVMDFGFSAEVLPDIVVSKIAGRPDMF